MTRTVTIPLTRWRKLLKAMDDAEFERATKPQPDGVTQGTLF